MTARLGHPAVTDLPAKESARSHRATFPCGRSGNDSRRQRFHRDRARRPVQIEGLPRMTLWIRRQTTRDIAKPENERAKAPGARKAKPSSQTRHKPDDVWRDFIRMLRASASSRP